MIIARILGGLGNQLFQYAAGRRLALARQTQLKLDISSYQPFSMRQYLLKAFNLQAEIATAQDLAAVKRTPLRPWLEPGYRLLRRKILRTAGYIKELTPGFDPAILSLPDQVYLDGYWQSEKYFLDIAETLRRELSRKSPLNPRGRDLAELIQKRNSVSVHVRRGDYAKNKKTKKHHGLLPISYYQQAVDHLNKKVGPAHFFIFSDDAAWCQKNLSLGQPSTVVLPEIPDNPTDDLYLLSLCRHHIIANSSFSWWGAWLCQNKDKMVIAPRQWFNDRQRDSRDVTPVTWEKL
jgi:hypothetical protein